jgi:hypothetical protein
MRDEVAVPSRRDQVSSDPQWDLALEIAGTLWLYGEHVVVIDPRPVQQLVDVQWAAHQAGRIIGVRSRIELTWNGWPDPRVTLVITFDDPDGRGLIRAQHGLDALLRSVLDQQELAHPSRVISQRGPSE